MNHHLTSRGQPWTASDRTGGPVDEVFDKLRQHVTGRPR